MEMKKHVVVTSEGAAAQLQQHSIQVDGSACGTATTTTSEDELCSGREKTLSLLVFLLALFSTVLLVYVSFGASLTSLMGSKKVLEDPGAPEGICDTKECVDISYHTLASGDFRDNPCKDFYRYSCSKWQAANPITTDHLVHAANINEIKDRVDLKFKELLEGDIRSKSGRTGDKHDQTLEKVEGNVRAFYQSCLNFVTPDEEQLISQLMAAGGGFQWSEGWSEDAFDLTNVTLKFLALNAAPLFDVMLDIDVKNRSKFAIIIDLPRPTNLNPSFLSSHGPRARDQDYFTNFGNWASRQGRQAGGDRLRFRHHGNATSGGTPSVVDRHVLYKMITENLEYKRLSQLKHLIRTICTISNVPEVECNAEVNDIAEVVETIQRSFLPRERTRKLLKQQNLVYNAYTLESLESIHTGIDWKELLGSLLGLQRKSVAATAHLNNVLGSIYVSYPDYLRRLLTFIQFTNKRVLYNSMLMVYVRDVFNDLMENHNYAAQEQDTTPAATTSKKSNAPNKPSQGRKPKEAPSSPFKSGSAAEEPRWKYCVQTTKSVFAMELSSLYLKSFDSKYLERVRHDVEGIFKMVKASLKSFLNRSTWLDSKSRFNALRKIETLKGNFLAPAFYLRPDYVDDSIKNIQIDSRDFVNNVLTVYRVFREHLYGIFHNKIDEDRVTWSFVTFPFVVNAFYIQQFNSIVIPLAFLSSPQYRLGAPPIINYATIGLTIAHEALHALDGSGRDFNENGMLERWIGETRGFLREKSSCVAQQYSEAFKSEIYFHQTKVVAQVDGNLTQNENMADMAGLQVAYDAYQRYRTSISKELRDAFELKLPGVQLTTEQLFFVSAAQAYCANITPLGYVLLLEMDEHTPHPERINGMVLNLPAFHKAFQCPLASPMNPKHKCDL